MTVREFLRSKTYTKELCIIRDERRCNVAAVLITQDIFLNSLSDRILNMQVRGYWHDTEIIKDCYGCEQEVRVHLILGESI